MENEKKIEEEIKDDFIESEEKIDSENVEKESDISLDDKKENDENLDVLRLKETIARLQADFINYKNRSEKEKSNIYKYASEGLVTKLLSVVDNFERALNTVREENSFTEGMRMVNDELNKILSDEGLKPIESDGMKFDPNLHHAVFMEESETVESEHIIETFQKGYTLNEKIIRPAMVKVAK